MKRLLTLCLSLIMVFLITGCGSSEGHDGEAKTPSGSSIQKGRDYESVVNDFKEQGFTNINLVELDDLVTGWMTKEGEVESVSVDGDIDYKADTWYPNDVEVVISYHTFPESNNEKTQHSSDSNDTTTPTEQESKSEILTTDNCEDLASILSIKAEIDSAYTSFAEKYKGQTVELDGCITYLTNHANYDTRYDILISAGDYVDENTANPGPIFKLEDVGPYDLGIKDLYLPDFVAVGENIKLQAKIKEFDSDAGVFRLGPVLMESR